MESPTATPLHHVQLFPHQQTVFFPTSTFKEHKWVTSVEWGGCFTLETLGLAKNCCMNWDEWASEFATHQMSTSAVSYNALPQRDVPTLVNRNSG